MDTVHERYEQISSFQASDVMVDWEAGSGSMRDRRETLIHELEDLPAAPFQEVLDFVRLKI